MKRLLILIAVPVCLFLVVTGTALLVLTAGPGTNAAPPQPAWVLRAWNGRVALFAEDAEAPTAQYDVYLSLLPETDAARLREGIRVESKDEAMRLLEDLGY